MVLFRTRRYHHRGVVSLLISSLLAAVALAASVATKNVEGDSRSERQQLWNRFVDKLNTATPEHQSLLQERAQALGQAYFGQILEEDEQEEGDVPEESIRRQLQSPSGPYAALNLTAPTRQCGEIIATLTLSDLETVAKGFVEALLPLSTTLAAFSPVALQFLSGALKYGIQVQKICSSCQQISELYAGEAFVTDTSTDYSFGTFCGSAKYGYGVTTSGLLLLPMDPSTSKPFSQATLRAAIFTHGTTAGSQHAPSGLFPSNFTAAVTQTNNTVLVYTVASLLDIIPAVIGASAGAVGIMPDYIGYGESYQFAKSYLVSSLYQQASVTLWLAARHMLASVAAAGDPCTVLDNVVTVIGYSEGGYAAFSACLAFNQLTVGQSKVRILSCKPGGAPLDLDYVVSYTFEQLQNKSNHKDAPAVVAFFGNAYSSTDVDLVNTNKGQDALINPYKSLAPVWLNVPSLMGVISIISAAGPLNTTNPNLVNLYLDLNSTTPVHACSGPGLNNSNTNFLCQAIVDNVLANPLLSADFPTLICHAKDDRLVPISNYPNISSNPNVQFYKPSISVLEPTGNHEGGHLYCVFENILSFASPPNASDSSQLISNATIPASACIVAAATSTSSAIRAVVYAKLSAVLAVFVGTMLWFV